MSRTRWILFALAASFVLLAAPERPGPAAKPPAPSPTLLAMTDNPVQGGAVAVSADGGIWVGQFRVWTRVGTTPSGPADIWSRASTGEVFIAMANGELYRLEPDRTLRFDSNVFTSAGAR